MTAPDSVVDLVPIDDLDRAIVGLTARINAATYELLVLVRQFDERVGWLRWGLQNCAEWLHWRCDLSMNAAREKVRVAHALKTLPVMSAAFAAGELSYSKCRALTRVANGANEQELVDHALKTTTRCVEERCREMRCGTRLSSSDAERAFARRSLFVRRDEARGTTTITIELPSEHAVLVERALDKARDDSVASRPEFADDSWSAKQADAFVELVQGYLSGGNNEQCKADHYQVTVHVDQSALAGGEGRAGLPVESVRRLCCDGSTIALVEDDNGEPLNVGRKTRVVPKAMMRALRARDKGCRFPGCHHTRFVDAHHVEHWANGGETRLDNLMLLCSRHHRLVHESGFRIDKDYQHRWTFYRPDGIAVPHCGYHAVDQQDDAVESITDPVNNPPRGGLMNAADCSGVSDRCDPATP